MSLSSILNIANSGLLTAQTGLRTVSDNVSNVSTPGYIRKVADQSATAVAGQGMGVDVTQIQLAADRFLQAAGLEATAQSGAAAATSSSLDQAQALFGDPNDATSFFTQLDGVFSNFSALSSDSSNATRSTAIGAVQTFLDQAGSISTSLTTLQSQAQSKASDDVATVNGLLKQIDALNSDISKALVTGKDATGSQNQQSGLIDQLSSLMDVHVSQRSDGGVVVRASDGLALAGDGGPATLTYSNTGGTGQVSVTLPSGSTSDMGGRLKSGELRGLLDLQNTQLPNMSAQLGEMVSQTVAALNAAHNANSAVPAPQTLSGRATSLSPTEAFSGITGKTTVSVVDATGKLQRQVAIDFGAGTMSVDGGAPTSFAPATFASSLNTALGTYGSASFSSTGQLTISAASGSGVAVADDPSAPTSKAGQGFSDFFGLNDLVTSSQPTDYDTGLTSASASGFSGPLTLRLTAADGSAIKDVTVDTTGATSMGDLVNRLNSATTGVGLYGSFALDDATGALAFTPAANSGVSLTVTSDTSSRGAGGPSLSAMFGIGDAVRATRTTSFSVRADIAADPSKLALARVDLTATATGSTVLYSGDASGADGLAQAGRATMSFDPAGGLVGGAQTVSAYASNLSSTIANASSAADAAKTNAASVATEATTRRSSVEGVNLDQELISMTTYQQAYNASARMIQTVNDLYTTLLGMLN